MSGTPPVLDGRDQVSETVSRVIWSTSKSRGADGRPVMKEGGIDYMRVPAGSWVYLTGS